MNERPFVFINMAMTADGKTAPVATQRQGPLVLSRGTEDPARMRRLRAQADAIVIGAGNARDDDPDLALAEDERARRKKEKLAEPLRVVVTRRGTGLSPALKMFDATRGGRSVLAHAAHLEPALAQAMKKIPGARAIELGDDAVEIPRLLAFLSQAGCKRVLVEGGAELNAQFFAVGAVDELYLTIVPRLLGGRTAPGAVSGEGLSADLVLASVERVEDELFLRYVVRPG